MLGEAQGDYEAVVSGRFISEKRWVNYTVRIPIVKRLLEEDERYPYQGVASWLVRGLFEGKSVLQIAIQRDYEKRNVPCPQITRIATYVIDEVAPIGNSPPITSIRYMTYDALVSELEALGYYTPGSANSAFHPHLYPSVSEIRRAVADLRDDPTAFMAEQKARLERSSFQIDLLEQQQNLLSESQPSPKPKEKSLGIPGMLPNLPDDNIETVRKKLRDSASKVLVGGA